MFLNAHICVVTCKESRRGNQEKGVNAAQRYYLKFCFLWTAGSMKGGPHPYGRGERTLSEYLINVKSVGGCGILIDDSIFISVSKKY